MNAPKKSIISDISHSSKSMIETTRRSLISIIIPVYKVENKISKCIESILLQTYDNFEIILVDDGSPDKSGEICDIYAKKDERIKVYHQINKGVSAARNIGLDNATGEWVTFIDSDDYIGNTYLEKLVGEEDLFENDIRMIGNTHVDMKGKTLPRSFLFPKMMIDIKGDKNLAHKLEKGRVFSYGYTYGHLYNVNVIKQNKIVFSNDMCLHEDHLFYFQYLKHVNRIFLRSENNYYYVIDSASVSLSRRPKTFDELNTAYKRLKDTLQIVCNLWELKDYGRCANCLLIIIRLRAIHAAYREDKKCNERMSLLLDISRKDILKYSRPKSLGGLLQYISFAFLPLTLIDVLLMKSANKIKN